MGHRLILIACYKLYDEIGSVELDFFMFNH